MNDPGPRINSVENIALLVAMLVTLETQLVLVEHTLAGLAEKDPILALLATVPGVGLIVAATFVSVIDEAKRFKNPHAVGAYLGLVALFERVKRSIKASPRMSRTEAFLKYAEEHPSEVLEAIDDKTDAPIRELEQKEREAARALRRGPPRTSRYTPEQLAEVPF